MGIESLVRLFLQMVAAFWEHLHDDPSLHGSFVESSKSMEGSFNAAHTSLEIR